MAIERQTQQYLSTRGTGSYGTKQTRDVNRSAHQSTNNQPARKKSNKYLSLEPRMMFDGAMAATAADVALDVYDLTFDGQREATNEDRRLFDALTAAPEPLFADIENSAPTQTVVFIDGTVADIETLIADLGANVEVHILDAHSDGVEQIAAILNGRTDIAALQIISHVEAGSLNLGSARLTAQSILGSHSDELAIIKSALSTDADILIYGCDFAAGDIGKRATELLATATGADIAASTDATGAAELGGDWDLESHTGFISAPALQAFNWFSTLATTINGTGGQAADNSDGLAIYVGNNGQLQIARALTGSGSGDYQLYAPNVTGENSSLFNGIYLAVGSNVSGPSNGADGGISNALWQSGGQTLTGAGTTADPFIVSTVLYSATDGVPGYSVATDTMIVVETIYVFPNAYFTERVTVTPSTANTNVIKYYHTMDTYLSGGDNGPAFSLPQNLAQTNNTTGVPTLVAVRKDPGGPNDSFVGFAQAQGSLQFDHWYSDYYTTNALYGYNAGSAGIDDGGDITNSWNTDPNNDNAVAIQFTLGAINTPTTFSYHVAFGGEASLDLDADDSSGAVGFGYNTAYVLGSGATIPITDVDAHIDNVIGDIQQLRITLSNPQVGDSLTVNAGSLPSGVTVLSQTATEIILGAVGTAQSEATFDSALQTLGYTTSSLSTTSRLIDFAVTNELGQEGFASAGTIAINTAPVANDDTFTFNEDTTLNGNLFANNGSGIDSDADAQAISVVTIDGGAFTVGVPIVLAHGTLTITNATTGAFTFIPTPDYFGPQTFSYGIVDTLGAGDTATVTLNITSVDDAPSLDLDLDDSSATNGNAAVTYTENGTAVFLHSGVLSADFDDTNYESAQIIHSNPQTGDVISVDSVAVTAGSSGSVAGVNYSVSTNGGGQLVIDFLGSASIASYTLALQSVSFSSTSEFPSTVTRDITFQVNDGSTASALRHALVTVTEVNDGPFVSAAISDQSASDGQTITISTIGNFSDPDGEVLHFTLGVGAPVWVSIDEFTGVITATPPAGASIGGPGGLGQYDITVIVTDSHAVALATSDEFRLTVSNLVPVAVDDHPAAADEDTVQSGNVISGVADPLNLLLQNDHDTAPDSDVLSVSAIAGGTVGTALPLTYGSLLLTSTGVWTFTPNAAANALDDSELRSEIVTYTVSDGNGGSASATLTISINGSNDTPAPIGTISNASLTDGQTISAINVTGAFDDLDGEPLIYTATGLPPGLSLNLFSGLITGTLPAEASQFGPYTVVVTASDGTASITQVFVIGVANLPPIANADAATIGEDAAITLIGNVISGIGSASDQDALPDADVLHVSAVNGAAANLGQALRGSTGGTFVVQADGTVSFNPGLDFQNLSLGQTRDTTISYMVSDGQGGFANASVTVTVTGSNDAPVPLGPVPPVNSADGLFVGTVDVGSMFVNPTSLVLNYSATGLPPGLSINSTTGIITGTFTNDASVGGPYFVNVTATAPDGSTATIPVRFNVANPAPVAANDSVQTLSNSPVVIAVLNNDVDADDDMLSVVSTTAPAHGAVVVNVDGTITYTPTPGYTGPDSFTYTVTDNQGGTSTATVNVNVGVPDAVIPTATPLAPVFGSDGLPIVPFSVAANFSDPNSDPLIFTATGLPPGLVLSPAGQVSGTPPNDASVYGPYTVYVTATDPAGNQVTVPMVITIGNPAPTAADDVAVTPLNTAVTLNVAGNDTDPDPDLDPLAVTAVTQPAHGVVVINANGTVTYTPTTGYTGADSFTYAVSDGQGGVDVASVSITVGGTNPNAPTANTMPDQPGVEGAAVSIDVNTLATVIDPNSDSLVYSAIGLPAGLSINPSTGVISGTLLNDASAYGPYMITVFVADPSGATIDVPFLFTVTNPAPVAAADYATTLTDQPINVSVLANDTDADGDALTVALTGAGTAAPAHGTVLLNADGTVKYSPNAGYTGSDSFTYKITDAQGAIATAIVTIDVGAPTFLFAPPAITPIAGTDGQTITPVPISALFGDPDTTGPLVVTVDLSALLPSITFNTTTQQFEGTAVNTASQGSTPGEPAGTYVVPVTAVDSNGLSATQFVTFIFTNNAPIAVDDAGTIGEDAGLTVLGNVLTDGVDDFDGLPDSDALFVAAVNGAPTLLDQPVQGSTGGTFVVKPDGTWSFDPGTDFQNLNSGDTRITSITYRVSDGQGGTDEATVSVTVTGSNDAPVALGPIPPVRGVDGQAVPATDVGVQFNNPSNLPLSFSATGLPQGLSIDPMTGVITGTLPNDASVMGPYVVTVTASAPDGSTASIPVLFIVSNPAPIAVGDTAQTLAGMSVVIAPLANDSDPDQDVLSIVSVGTPSNGTVVINPDGTVTYTPAGGYVGSDSFTYTVTDNQGGTSVAMVNVNVGPPDAVTPTGTALAPATGVDGDPIVPINVALNFNDPNLDALTFTATGLPAGLTISPTGVISGTLESDASVDGPYTVYVTATDPAGHQATLPLVIAVTNPAPIAGDDSTSTMLNTPVVIGVLGNDMDSDNDALNVSAVTQPAHGTAVINSDGTITYTPTTGYNGSDSFSYSVSDGQGGVDTATISVTVGALDTQQPTASTVAAQTGVDGTSISINVQSLSAAADPDNGVLTYSASGLPAGLSIDPSSGIISGTLSSDASVYGPYMIHVFATNPTGSQVGIPFLFTAINPAPVTSNDVASTLHDQPVTIAVLANDIDPDHDLLTVTMTGLGTVQPAQGTVTVNPNGTITYMPFAGYTGADSFTYRISDGQGGSSNASVNLSVGPSGGLTTPSSVMPIIGTDGETISPVPILSIFGDPDTTGPLTITVNISALPPGITFNSLTNQFEGTATNAASQSSTPGDAMGHYVVPVTATDGNGLSSTQYVPFTFSNVPPTAVDDVASSDEDTAQSGNVLTDVDSDGAGPDTATGDFDTAPDSDFLSVTAVMGGTVGSPMALTYGTLVLDSTGAWTFTPNALANALPVGTTMQETVSYTVFDGNGGTDAATLTIDIVGLNDFPVGTPIDPQVGFEGSPFTLPTSPHFSDPDTPDVLTYSATGLPTGLSIDPNTGVISGTLPVGSSAFGPYSIIVTVDDQHGGTTTETFILDVKVPAGVFDPPPPPPPSPDRLVIAPLPDIVHVIDRTIDTLGDLQNSPDLHDHVIMRVVQNLADVNSVIDLDDGTDRISKLVSWLGKQGRSADWIDGLLTALDNAPYLGDQAGLALSSNGQMQFEIRTLIHDGALFIGVDTLANGASVKSLREIGRAGLPDFAARLGAQDIVINVPAKGGWFELHVLGTTAAGQDENWYIAVHMDTGEVLPLTRQNRVSEDLSMQLMKGFHAEALLKKINHGNTLPT